MSRTYMGQELKMSEADRLEGITDEEAYVEAAFDLSYDVANYLECAAHFLLHRFLKDEHDIHFVDRKQVLGLETFRPGAGT